MPKNKHPVPEWINAPWLNKSWLCKALKGNSDKSTVAYFTLQRQGDRPLSNEELAKLEEIKKGLGRHLKGE